jgi:alpha-galactosidase
VFGTQKLLARILKEQGFGEIARDEIKVNVVGINHFTWLTSARYKNMDLFPVYRDFCAKNVSANAADDNWMNNSFKSLEMVKMELFRRYGTIAAAGDRHLAEFCPGSWFLKDPEGWGFHLTPVSWRKDHLLERLEKSRQYLEDEIPFTLKETGEDGVRQMRAILGLSDLVTNVNLPNVGQISNLPLGAVVETNAYFTAGTVTPVISGEVPYDVNALVSRHVYNQEKLVEAALNRDLELAFNVFMNDPLVTVDRKDGRTLFDEMVNNTKEYLKEYF